MLLIIFSISVGYAYLSSIDASMVKSTNRRRLQDMNKSQSVRICVSQFQIYAEKSDREIENLGSKIDLTRAIVGKRHEVHFDNVFATLPHDLTWTAKMNPRNIHTKSNQFYFGVTFTVQLTHEPRQNKRLFSECLKLVKHYNTHIFIVDQSREWWHRLFWHFLELPIFNAEKPGIVIIRLSLIHFRRCLIGTHLFITEKRTFTRSWHKN